MIALFLALAVTVQPDAAGFLGRELTDVVKTPFFTTYKLAEVRRRSSGEFSQVVFQPDGPLRDHVQLFGRVNGEGETRIIDAAIDRAFIDGADAAAARGFVMALLRDGMPKGDEPAIDALLGELAGAPRERGSLAYEVFAGRQPALTASGKRTRVTLSNVGAGAARALRISLHRAGRQRG